MIILDEKATAAINSNSQFLEIPSQSQHRRASSASTSSSNLLAPPPPPYLKSSRTLRQCQSASTLSLASVSSQSSTMTYAHRSNHLYITRGEGSIKGSWIIDTALSLPPAMLPPVEEGRSRLNIKLHSKMGRISARVEVRGQGNTAPDANDQRATLLFRSEKESVKLRLRRAESPRLCVTCEAPRGSVTLYLPNNFQGAIRTHTCEDSVSLSSGVRRNATQIVRNHRRCVHFIGSCPGPGHLWDGGDEVDIDAPHGAVKILFVDEHEDRKLVSSVNDMITNIRCEGMKSYVERVVVQNVEKAKEKCYDELSVSRRRIGGSIS